ncbi:capsular polysaccharide biosynthesis protein CapF [Halobacillus mangrovi]|uniref:capsular polysaccharide biosynthesis protein CapF n=1 Tax=Halobacillus mangrovi TaxID=402384 RepID=UPI003D99D86C
MNILVTGAEGFIGKNLVAELYNQGYKNIFQYTRKTSKELLDDYCQKADFVFHLAGVNRPINKSEFMSGNYGFTSELIILLKKHQNTCPILTTSSIQAELENPYGISKKAGENVLFHYEKDTGANVLIYRLPNVFGKWCKPNYNSVVATFCHNIAHDHPIQVKDPNRMLNLVYIDDVINELIDALNGRETAHGDFCKVPIEHEKTLGEIAELTYSFKQCRKDKSIPDMSDPFIKKLYSTYLSYIPKNQFSYDLKMNIDDRGSFTEFIRTIDTGQVSVNVSKPGITKGNHWHHTKNEKFLVVSGRGVIRFRKYGSEEIIEYFVSGDKMEVVDIPTGYTHNIENIGNTDMVTIMWANEMFDKDNPDTYHLEV